jgi:hypothetical protein
MSSESKPDSETGTHFVEVLSRRDGPESTKRLNSLPGAFAEEFPGGRGGVADGRADRRAPARRS